MRGRALALLLLAGLAQASEPDGAIAPAARWTGPRGPASGSLRSLATPVVHDVEEAWHLECDRVYTSPVHWDGRGYVAAHWSDKDCLIAFDVRTGEVIAHKTLPGVPPELFVWDHTVYCQAIPGQINAYRLRGRVIHSTWKFRGRRSEDKTRLPRRPLVHDNEVYCLSGSYVVRMRPPGQWPVWAERRSDRPYEPLAVYGQTLFGLGLDDGVVMLEMFERRTGRVDGMRLVAATAHADPPELTVTPGMIFVKPPGLVLGADQKPANYLLIRCAGTGFARPTPRQDMFVANLDVPPAHTRFGVLCMGRTADGREWRLLADDGRYQILAKESPQPHLFRDRVSPVVLGDVVYFGSWAADLATREILWVLPVKSVSFPVTPADRMLIVVDDGRVLRAFRGRGKH